MGTFVKILTPRFNLNIGKFSLPIPYFEAALVVLLIFVLILSFAQFRRHTVNWSLKGILFGTFFGFVLALTIEAFLIINGKTFLIGVLGWKNAPAPISLVLDVGRSKLVQVLGTNTQTTNVDGTIQLLQSLNPADVKKVKAIFCR
jgi:hypothetical protein